MDPRDDDPNAQVGTAPQIDPFEAALSKTSREFQDVARQVHSSLQSRDSLVQAQSAITAPGLTLEQRGQRLQQLGFAQDGIAAIKQQIEGGNGSAAVASLQSQANSIWTGVQADYDRLVSLDPLTTADLFPDSMADSGRLKFARGLLDGSGGSGGGSAPAVQYQIQIGPHGELIRTGSNGSFDIIGSHPELAQKNVQVQTNQMTGEAFALTLDADGNVANRTSLGQVAYPQLDPEKQFRLSVLTQASNVESALQGIELQRRGQVITELGNDWSREVSIGQMGLQEAQLNLNRIDTALTQRRNERADVLKYGVTKASLHQNAAGETVTRLPFADQFASILTAATGRTFSPDQFDLGTTYVSPDQAAADAMNGSAFNDPIPGLQTSKDQIHSTIQDILNQPLPGGAAGQQILKMAAAVPGA